MSIDVITANVPRCVQRFDRDNYAEEFARFCAVCREYFSVPRPDFAEEFMAFTRRKTEKRIGRSSKLFDLRVFLCVYLCPAGKTVGGEAAERASELAAAWNAAYPQFFFEAGSYEDIASGFRTKPFGL